MALTPKEVLPSSEARRELPKIIESLSSGTADIYEVGRQRKREVVIMSASHFDEMSRVSDLARDIAWAEFASDRIANPTSLPVSWDEAQRRRKR